MSENRKCPPGCTCGRHKSSTCAPGCTCKRHGDAINKGMKCPEGCTCKRHSPPKRPKRSREEQLAVDREYKRRIRAVDPEKHRGANRRWYVKNERYYRYGLTAGAWQDLWDSQGGCCYLCGAPMDSMHSDAAGRRTVYVDHDHTCCAQQRTCGSCVRGLACSGCNTGIGQFGDDPERIRRAAHSLRAAKEALASRRADLLQKAAES